MTKRLITSILFTALTIPAASMEQANALMTDGNWDAARREYLSVHASLEKTLGPEHLQTVLALANDCDASVQLTARLDALPLCMRALALREKR